MLDLGIIRAVQTRYRKALQRIILCHLHAGRDSKIDIRQAMRMKGSAWSEISGSRMLETQCAAWRASADRQ
jgi:hypothetical protein